jgi:hypothetical protein
VSTVLLLCVIVAAQSGETYEIMDSVIANGGGASAAGTYDISGTVGQNFAAGSESFGGAYSHTAGFWNSQLAPTAAGVSIGGRVLSATGSPLNSVRVTLADPAGTTRTTLSNTFGYYRFDDVEVGARYLVSAIARQFQFEPRVVTVADEITELDIVATP